jgi:hypothetical protein
MITERSAVDVDSALAQVAAFDGRTDIRSAIRLLMSADRDAVEPRLLDLMETYESRHNDPFWIASRILAERDPDRDPRYLLQYIRDTGPVRGNSPIHRWVRKIDVYPPVSYFVYGLSRLRRFDPVHTYAALLDEPSGFNRMTAASALGDTADPAALAPLAMALADPKRTVRTFGVNAVRRLGHSVSAEAVLEHPTGQKMVAALGDKDRGVAVMAAFALADLGGTEAVREFCARNPRRLSLFKRPLAGDIPPLRPAWPGDDTV